MSNNSFFITRWYFKKAISLFLAFIIVLCCFNFQEIVFANAIVVVPTISGYTTLGREAKVSWYKIDGVRDYRVYIRDAGEDNKLDTNDDITSEHDTSKISYTFTELKYDRNYRVAVCSLYESGEECWLGSEVDNENEIEFFIPSPKKEIKKLEIVINNESKSTLEMEHLSGCSNFKVNAIYSDGTVSNITKIAEYSSTNENVAYIYQKSEVSTKA